MKVEIDRNLYVDQLESAIGNGMIKIITGIRRCGKSYLLFNLFRRRLEQKGVDTEHIITIDLEDRRNFKLRDPDALLNYIDTKLTDSQIHYVLIDEIQHVKDFEDVLNSYLHRDNAEVFVTGSNSKLLSKDVITEFRGRGWEIRIHPLSFKELSNARPNIERRELLKEYLLYGGLPMTTIINRQLCQPIKNLRHFPLCSQVFHILRNGQIIFGNTRRCLHSREIA